MDQRPRSPRVPVEFPLGIEGTDESGKPFQAEGTAVKISHAGDDRDRSGSAGGLEGDTGPGVWC